MSRRTLYHENFVVLPGVDSSALPMLCLQLSLKYDVKQLEKLAPIDMLIIDGPPIATQRLARYPVLPLLFHRLSDDAVILLDDAD